MISKRLLSFFGNYSDGFLRRHFHSLRLLKNGSPATPDALPLVVYLNHASWWDPLVCLLIARRLFRGRDSYAPIESRALQRYRFLQRLGFFGVATETVRGAVDFLHTARSILARNQTALWLTPQGKFVDPRARPLRFQRGLSHLTTQVERAAFVPLAIEYTFWEERLPEILIGFGAPLIFDADRRLSIPEVTQLFECALTSVQDDLAAASLRRKPDEWEMLEHGGGGTSRVYDLWRRTRAKLRGETFRASHSDL